jgi:hypothetical protein
VNTISGPVKVTVKYRVVATMGEEYRRKEGRR